MKNIVFILISVFMFSACSTSSLSLKENDELILNYSTDELCLSNKVIENELLNYRDLFVKQFKLKNKEGRVLFYEEARTALNYEFNFSALNTVMYAFDNAKEYEEVYHRNNLSFIQLKLRNKNYINILIQASDTQVISYVYGFSNEEFMQLAKNTKVDSRDKIEALKFEGITLHEDMNFSTVWNDILVYFTPLIRSLNSVRMY